jgi:hypothetical protein
MTPSPPEGLQLRACGCSFCRMHGGRTVSDPKGMLTIVCAGSLHRYQFATRKADFLLCSNCGVYIGATMEADGKCYGVLNVNVLDDQSPFAREPQSVTYDGEDIQKRIDRRIARWTPAEITGSLPVASRQ